MSVASWTNTFELRLGVDLDSVVAWYGRPERRAEVRAHFESWGMPDFRYEEREEDGRRVTTTSWTTPAGLHVFLEIRGNLVDPPMTRDGEGRVVRRVERYQYRRWPDGREDRSFGETVAEFRDRPGGGTLVRMTISRRRDRAPWWERWLPPVAERSAERRATRELFARCEKELGAGAGRPGGDVR
jgi:hypothetical protein